MKLIVTVLATLAIAACGRPAAPPRTVNDLAEDPAVVEGLAARCEADKRAKFTDVECANARRAMERLGAADDGKRNAEHEAEFERQRAQRRAKEEAEKRAAAQANPPFDPYSTPVATEPAAGAPKP